MGKGTFTGKLHETALALDQKKSNDTAAPTSAMRAPVLPIYVYGPYGSVAVDLNSSSVIAMFAGGIGITPFISIFTDL